MHAAGGIITLSLESGAVRGCIRYLKISRKCNICGAKRSGFWCYDVSDVTPSGSCWEVLSH